MGADREVNCSNRLVETGGERFAFASAEHQFFGDLSLHRSAQSPRGKDEKFSQSPAAEMRCVLAGWLLAGRRLAAACC